jgi:hypothetical protein
MRVARLVGNAVAAAAFPVALILTSCGTPASPTAPSPASPRIVLAALDISPSVIGGQPAHGSASLNTAASEGGVVLTLAADNPAVTTLAPITIPAGATHVEFELDTVPVTKTTGVTISARVGDSQRLASLMVRIDPRSTRPSVSYTLSFSGLRDNRLPLAVYDELGFSISAVSGNWVAITTFGRPAPFIQFMSAPGVTTTGEIKITAGGEAFWLTSLDVYSSTTKIPYVIEGLLGTEQMFTLLDVLGNTFGNFARVSNPSAEVPVDVLLVRLSNPSAPCCGNPMGIDNIVLRR